MKEDKVREKMIIFKLNFVKNRKQKYGRGAKVLRN